MTPDSPDSVHVTPLPLDAAVGRTLDAVEASLPSVAASQQFADFTLSTAAQIASFEQRTREQLNAVQTLLTDIETLASFPSPEAEAVIRDRILRIRSLIGYP